MIVMKKKLTIGILLFVFLAAVFVTIGMAVSGQEVFNGERLQNPDRFVLDFTRMTKEDTGNLEAEAGDVLLCSWEIRGGRVNICIRDEAGDVLYRADGADTADFKLPITMSGRYTVTVDAGHAAGRIEIRVEQTGTDVNS